MNEHRQQYLEQMEVAQGSGFGGIITAISAVGDLKIMWKELAVVAPSEIQADVEVVSDSWQQQEENAGQMDWTAILATGLLNSGSMSRVDSYIKENCDGDYSVPAEATTAEEDSTEIATPEPRVVLLEDRWTDDDGYSFEFRLNTAVGGPTKDVANARPGEAEITWAYSFTGEIKNATDQRNASTPTISMQPVWAAGSRVCSLINVTHGFSFPYSDDEDLWCTLASAPYRLAGGSSLAIDETASMAGSASAMLPLIVPEADADALLAELESPPIWAMGRDYSASDVGVCYTGGGTIYVSKVTVDTGCGV